MEVPELAITAEKAYLVLVEIAAVLGFVLFMFDDDRIRIGLSLPPFFGHENWLGIIPEGLVLR
jgi:hypothetical protein